MSIPPEITSLGSAAAAVVVVFLFLKFWRDERKADRTERVADRAVWENHLSETVKALVALREEQKRQGEEARDHHRRSQ